MKLPGWTLLRTLIGGVGGSDVIVKGLKDWLGLWSERCILGPLVPLESGIKCTSSIV